MPHPFRSNQTTNPRPVSGSGGYTLNTRDETQRRSVTSRLSAAFLPDNRRSMHFDVMEAYEYSSDEDSDDVREEEEGSRAGSSSNLRRWMSKGSKTTKSSDSVKLSKVINSYHYSKDQNYDACSNVIEGYRPRTSQNISKILEDDAFKGNPEEKFIVSTMDLNGQDSKPPKPIRKKMMFLYRFRCIFCVVLAVSLAVAIGVGVWAAKRASGLADGASPALGNSNGSNSRGTASTATFDVVANNKPLVVPILTPTTTTVSLSQSRTRTLTSTTSTRRASNSSSTSIRTLSESASRNSSFINASTTTTDDKSYTSSDVATATSTENTNTDGESPTASVPANEATTVDAPSPPAPPSPSPEPIVLEQVPQVPPAKAAAAAASSASGTISSLINRDAFNSACDACNVHVDLYDSMTAAFGTTPLPGGLNELSIMMGNLALESIKFTATHQWGCDKNPGSCQRYYGRGFIQLTGLENYQNAGNAIGVDIVNNPDLVAEDQVVNWKTVIWYWTSRVQPFFGQYGLSLSTSVLAIDPDENCVSRGGYTNMDRVALVQCFQDHWIGFHDTRIDC
ncbi:hypothetical protein BDR26DRAFT_870997 [Obelidium mucronatum]|nr:hypothetical protein BDR26DRAFT_870997 [Obelidium mucronatum]